MTEKVMIVSSSYILLKADTTTFYVGRRYWDLLRKAIRVGKRLREGEIRVIDIETGETIIPREEELEEEYEEEELW